MSFAILAAPSVPFCCLDCSKSAIRDESVERLDNYHITREWSAESGVELPQTAQRPYLLKPYLLLESISTIASRVNSRTLRRSDVGLRRFRKQRAKSSSGLYL